MQLPIEWLPAKGPPEQLILLLHGWGSDAMAMAPLAQALRSAFPQAAVLAPDAPGVRERGGAARQQRDGAARQQRDGAARQQRGGAARQQRDGAARQWYSIVGLTPEVWAERVATVLPGLQAWVRVQQQRLGVGPAATALGGFSQGAILSLALALQDDGIAGRVLAFGGRLVVEPQTAPRHTTVHLFHGADDRVLPAEGSRQALAWLGELQGDATLDIAHGVGHELHPALIDCALHRLKNHIPLRTWQAALGAASATDPQH